MAVRGTLAKLGRHVRMTKDAARRERATNRGSNGKGGSSWIRRDLRLTIYIRDFFTCCICQGDLRGAHPSYITLDHYVPRNGHTDNRPANLFMACIRCNSSRRDHSVREFYGVEVDERVRAQMAMPINRELARAILDGSYTGSIELALTAGQQAS